jgi:hypothetical protein
VETLLHEQDNIVLHLCKNMPPEEAEYVYTRLQGQSNVFFAERTRANWGSIGIVQATLNGMKKIMEENLRFDYMHLLSGQDFPIKSRINRVTFFNLNRGNEFMTNIPIDSTDEGPYFDPIYQRLNTRNQKHRYNQYFFSFDSFKYLLFPGEINKHPRSWRHHFINLIKINLRYLRKKNFYRNLKPYMGSAWFSITNEAMNYILNWNQAHPDYLRFMKFTWCPDESFFQSIILNSYFQEKVINDDLRLIKWDENHLHPIILNSSHRSELLESPRLFARKFDLNHSPEIINLIDNQVLEGKHRLTENFED